MSPSARPGANEQPEKAGRIGLRLLRNALIIAHRDTVFKYAIYLVIVHFFALTGKMGLRFSAIRYILFLKGR